MFQYGTVAKPFNDILKKDNFCSTQEAKLAFQELKDLLVSAPILALPNFDKEFVVEAYALGTGIEVVLMQDNHPIAFISGSLNV